MTIVSFMNASQEPVALGRSDVTQRISACVSRGTGGLGGMWMARVDGSVCGVESDYLVCALDEKSGIGGVSEI